VFFICARLIESKFRQVEPNIDVKTSQRISDFLSHFRIFAFVRNEDTVSQVHNRQSASERGLVFPINVEIAAGHCFGDA